jgi:hypothetical protein
VAQVNVHNLPNSHKIPPPGRLRQRDDTAGEGEGRARNRGSSDGVTCTRDDRQHVPCSAGGL